MKTCKICKKEYDLNETEYTIYKTRNEQDKDGKYAKKEVIWCHKNHFKKYCLPCSVNKNSRWR